MDSSPLFSRSTSLYTRSLADAHLAYASLQLLYIKYTKAMGRCVRRKRTIWKEIEHRACPLWPIAR